MSGISETIAQLSRMGSRAAASGYMPVNSRLSRLDGFGSNPGQLLARTYVPASLASGAALVVVLHGCTQNAEGYDHGSGWSALADEAGFAVLLPEQQRSNNSNLCFNWFERDDATRDRGELLSIWRMVTAMLARYDLDPACVFVTGLSAGGAMTSALLAAYPDVFAGGAIIAGLPYDTAQGVSQALQRMRSAAPIRTARLRDEMREATGHDGPWPTVSVWHGDRDSIVDASNAAAIVAQWRAIHGADAAREKRVDGQRRQVWSDAAGRAVVESWTIAGMGHGTPLATSGLDACGVVGPHMLEAGISSTRHIARFWGLLPARDVREDAAVASPRATGPGPMPAPVSEVRLAEMSGPGAVIEKALRAAGLMK